MITSLWIPGNVGQQLTCLLPCLLLQTVVGAASSPASEDWNGTADKEVALAWFSDSIVKEGPAPSVLIPSIGPAIELTKGGEMMLETAPELGCALSSMRSKACLATSARRTAAEPL